MNVRLYCPVCEASGKVNLPGTEQWMCPGCDHIIALAHPHPEAALPSCACCGTAELYKKKDFPHGLGMTVLVGAFVASTITYWLYNNVLTWGILLGSAAFDGILYLLVKDVIVCYRCGAEHRGVEATAAHQPFELTIHERYRQERLRKEQIGK